MVAEWWWLPCFDPSMAFDCRGSCNVCAKTHIFLTVRDSVPMLRLTHIWRSGRRVVSGGHYDGGDPRDADRRMHQSPSGWAVLVFHRSSLGFWPLLLRFHSAAASRRRWPGVARSRFAFLSGTAATDSGDGRNDTFIHPLSFFP